MSRTQYTPDMATHSESATVGSTGEVGETFPVPGSSSPIWIRRLVISAWGILLVGTVADLGSTIYALEVQSGFYESNPLSRMFYLELGVIGLAIVKALSIAVAVISCHAIWLLGRSISREAEMIWIFLPVFVGIMWFVAGLANLATVTGLSF